MTKKDKQPKKPKREVSSSPNMWRDPKTVGPKPPKWWQKIMKGDR